MFLYSKFQKISRNLFFIPLPIEEYFIHSTIGRGFCIHITIFITQKKIRYLNDETSISLFDNIDSKMTIEKKHRHKINITLLYELYKQLMIILNDYKRIFFSLFHRFAIV